MQHLATVKFKTHAIHISRDQDKIYCFKYTTNRCDLEVFDSQESAGDYIITPFPDSGWQVVVSGEE